MASYVTWKDYYSVGDESLDAQHKQLLGIINELYGAMGRGADHAAVRTILDRLLQYTLQHFKYEEQVMLSHDYPDLMRHKGVHDRMRQRTIDLLDNVDLVTGRDLLIFLKEWWCNHIQEQDKQYAPYLKVTVEA